MTDLAAIIDAELKFFDSAAQRDEFQACDDLGRDVLIM